MNKVKLDWELIRSFTSNKKSVKYSCNKDDAYGHQQIQALLSVCNLRQKAIVLIYASTGIRAGALPPLKLKHIQRLDLSDGHYCEGTTAVTINPNDIYKFTVYENDEEYFTLCTPECRQAIDAYLEFRQRYGEKLTPESPLIREDFDIYEPGKKRLNPKHIEKQTIQGFVSTTLNKIGLREVDRVNGQRNRKRVKLIHGFRKFFETQLLESDVNYVVAKMLMGHDLKLEESYFRPHLDFIVREYSKAVNNLTINPENRLKKRIHELTEKQDEITVMKLKHEKEMEELRAQMNVMQQSQKEILECMKYPEKLVKIANDG